MNKQRITCYNILFPPFLLIFFAPLWVFILPLNALIDWLVLRAAFRAQGIADEKALARQGLMRVCLCGFLADLIGAALVASLMLSDFLSAPLLQGIWPLMHAGGAFYNSLKNIGTFTFMGFFVALTALLIYLFNRHYCLRHLSLTPHQRHITALILAVVTAPWFFLAPLAWFI